MLIWAQHYPFYPSMLSSFYSTSLSKFLFVTGVPSLSRFLSVLLETDLVKDRGEAEATRKRGSSN